MLPYQKSAERPEDWMGQYQQEAESTVPVQSSSPPPEEVPKATYEAMFRHQHGVSETARPAIDPQLVSAATLVLDQRTEDATSNKADQLLGSLQSEGPSVPFPANQALAKEPASPAPPLSNDGANSPPVDDLEF